GHWRGRLGTTPCTAVRTDGYRQTVGARLGSHDGPDARDPSRRNVRMPAKHRAGRNLSDETSFTCVRCPTQRRIVAPRTGRRAHHRKRRDMLVDEIKAAMFKAMKAGYTIKKEVLRTALGEATATGETADDARMTGVLRKLVKSNEETLA